jgi:TRAP-type mannitol/chloroaromatic compound transport system permease small subunit
MKKFVNSIDTISKWVFRIMAPLLLVLSLIVCYEVISRWAFNKPTLWVHEISGFIFGVTFILAGAYVLHVKAHVNVDILPNALPPRARAGLNIFNFLFILITCAALVWYGSTSAWDSIKLLEHSQTEFSPPLYPIRAVIPIGAFLVLLEGVADLIRNIHLAATGREL